MASASPSSAYLSAGAAVAVALVSAFFTAAGPWEPMSVILGWVVVVAVTLSVLSGSPGVLAAAAAVHVARVGVHGIAEDQTPGLVMSAVILVAVVEFGSLSIESRGMPVDWASALAATIVKAAGSGIVVGVLAVRGDFSLLAGPGTALVGLAAAVGVGALVLWIQRRFVGA